MSLFMDAAPNDSSVSILGNAGVNERVKRVDSTKLGPGAWWSQQSPVA